jgi:hypothetical protein
LKKNPTTHAVGDGGVRCRSGVGIDVHEARIAASRAISRR